MGIIAAILVGLVAIEHIYILYLEMFAWTKPRTLKTFGIKKEDAETTKTLAANQGLYNGFLAAGLFWGLLHPTASVSWQLQVFFILCVVTAALYGGFTAKRSILMTQGLPALLALIALVLSRS